ncbi:MAG: heat-inducible transcriptional repressor HrcA, partial [Gemmatimonadales bacterium]
MPEHTLSDREQLVLEAVIHSYVSSAEPAGSRTIAKNFALGVSAATVRNTMSDLEEKGFLYHPHTSAGRIPTDLAYRVYVDRLMAPSLITRRQQETLTRELADGASEIESLLDKTARVLGVLTQELGIALSPSFEDAVLERLELVPVSSQRILMVLVLQNAVAPGKRSGCARQEQKRETGVRNVIFLASPVGVLFLLAFLLQREQLHRPLEIPVAIADAFDARQDSRALQAVEVVVEPAATVMVRVAVHAPVPVHPG